MTKNEILCQCYKSTGKCYAPATVKIKRTNIYACDDCYLAAVFRLGCNLTYSKVPAIRKEINKPET